MLFINSCVSVWLPVFDPVPIFSEFPVPILTPGCSPAGRDQLLKIPALAELFCPNRLLSQFRRNWPTWLPAFIFLLGYWIFLVGYWLLNIGLRF